MKGSQIDASPRPSSQKKIPSKSLAFNAVELHILKLFKVNCLNTASMQIVLKTFSLLKRNEWRQYITGDVSILLLSTYPK